MQFSMRRALVVSLLVTLLLAAGAAALLAGREPARAAGGHQRAAERAELPPLPAKRRAQVVEPVAGAGTAAGDAPVAVDDGRDRRPSAPASAARRGDRDTGTIGGGLRKATALGSGVALPPLEAPDAVREIIEAGNAIARTPYKWGGGHGRWLDSGYDCSGSVSFALAAAGLLEGPRTSGALMGWGEPGPGKWVTIYASDGHVYLEVAGVRFDTSGARRTGSRWQNDLRGRRAGFVARHPAGL